MTSDEPWRGCKPQYSTPRSPNRFTVGGAIASVAESLGQPLMEWQRHVADIGGEILPTGQPAYREVIVSVPRQSGKTTLVLSFELQRALGWIVPQRVAYTAQTGWDARRKLLDDQVPLIEKSKLAASVKRVYRGAGSEGVVFRNGSRIDVVASSQSSGHGKTLDLGVIDEAFDDQDDRREQAILPAMVTRRDGQLLVVSTMGTDTSTYLNRKIDVGRAAALEGRTSGVAYFEWSIPEGLDLRDPAAWALGMPALGLTVAEATVAHAQATMAPGEFRRAFGNQRTRSSERAIPEATWNAVRTTTRAAADRVVFGVEVSPDRDWAAIASCGADRDGTPVVELIDHRPGVGWVVDRVTDLGRSHGGAVVVEKSGPAGALIGELERAGVTVTDLAPSDITRACGAFYDAVADMKVWVRADHRLDAAVAIVARQPVGDVWRWGRKRGGDVSPLMAATLAHHGNTAAPSFFFY